MDRSLSEDSVRVTDERSVRKRSDSGWDHEANRPKSGRDTIGSLHQAAGNQAVREFVEDGRMQTTQAAVVQRSAKGEQTEGGPEGGDSPSPDFSVGDTVTTTDNLRIREAPGTDQPIKETTPVGVAGDVVGGPVMADGYSWWHIEYHAGYTGWSAQPWLTKTSPSETEAGQTADRPGTGKRTTEGKTTIIEDLPPYYYYDKVKTIEYNYNKFGPGQVTQTKDLPPYYYYDEVKIVTSHSTKTKYYK